ncbi:MFS transporter [[Bacillus] enclensis]|uniref:MFS transporter n=1 Tax=[Bacillus] enclensis TaxID=1402860 RepID=UPI000509C12B|nr:MFS transporter [[Bacillus] enclensis]MBH9967465.1 MFS transporter [[Bacillus] enclensis]QWC21690.1 MFS transporter [Bacillus haikouensis]
MTNKKLVTVIGLLPVLMVLGNSMLIPILPSIEKGLDIDERWSGWILSSFTIPAAVCIPFIGFLSDRFGRNRLIRYSLWTILAGSILCAVSVLLKDPAFLFMGGRGLQGVGAAGTAPLAIALAGDLYNGEERSKVLGALEVFNGMGKVFAPIIGAGLTIFLSWNHAFWVFPLLCLAILFGLKSSLELINEKKHTQGVKKYARDLASVMMTKWQLLLPLYAIGGIGLFLLFGILFFLSYHIENTFHIDGFFKGFTFMFPLGAMTISSFWSGKRIKTDEERGWYYIKWGLGLMSVPLGILVFFHSLSALLFLLTVCFGGLGLILPVLNTFITGSVEEGERGFVVSMYGAARFLGVALGPIAYSSWMKNDTGMYIITFLFSAVNILLYMLAGHRGKVKINNLIKE